MPSFFVPLVFKPVRADETSSISQELSRKKVVQNIVTVDQILFMLLTGLYQHNQLIIEEGRATSKSPH